MEKRSVAFMTLGCKVNQYETSAMENDFINNGFEIKHNGSYDQLVSNVDLMTQNGYSVNVSTRATEKISMTNGTRLGWTTLGGPGQTAGHAMTFRGFDTDGNIIVSSWGELYTIPKMYFDKLDFTAVKVE